MLRSSKFALVTVTLIIAVFGAFIIFVSVSSRLDDVQNVVIEEIDLSNVNDGKYHGESNVSPVYIEIDIYIENHEITNIDVKYINMFINEEELNSLIELIYENQSFEFDYSEYDLYTRVALFSAVYDSLN